MKHFNKLFAAVFMFVGLSAQAQDRNNPWAVSFGVNAMDGGRVSAAGPVADQFSQYFDVNAYWNILPSVSYITVARNVGDNFSVGITGSINKVDIFVSPRPTIPGDYVVTNPGDLMYYGADVLLKYSFMDMLKSKVFDPYVHAGGGYTWLGKGNSGTANGGLGINFWISELVGLTVQSTYKYAFEEDRADMPTHMQHFVGITFKFGAKDTDGDKIPDYKDACPDTFGLKEYNGCPDTDGDTVIDKDDACPDTFGLVALKGCPDEDGDGTPDKDDKCPTVPGPKDNAGCPIPPKDADMDGVPDMQDDCPLIPGPAENKGCPYLTKETLELVRIEAKSVFFKTGSSVLDDSKGTSDRLDAIKEILKNYPTAKWSIDGYTDNTGGKKLNQKLSEARAKVVRDALVARGINPDNITYKGHGDANPVASNKTAAGRAENRRTEVNYVGGVPGAEVNKELKNINK